MNGQMEGLEDSFIARKTGGRTDGWTARRADGETDTEKQMDWPSYGMTD